MSSHRRGSSVGTPSVMGPLTSEAGPMTGGTSMGPELGLIRIPPKDKKADSAASQVCNL